MRFEWDEQKNQTNIRKHGLDFVDAHKIFDSPMLVKLDTRYEYGGRTLGWNWTSKPFGRGGYLC